MAQAPKRPAPRAAAAPRGVPDTEPGMMAPPYVGNRRGGLRDLGSNGEPNFNSPEPPIKLARGGRAKPAKKRR